MQLQRQERDSSLIGGIAVVAVVAGAVASDDDLLQIFQPRLSIVIVDLDDFSRVAHHMTISD